MLLNVKLFVNSSEIDLDYCNQGKRAIDIAKKANRQDIVQAIKDAIKKSTPPEATKISKVGIVIDAALAILSVVCLSAAIKLPQDTYASTKIALFCAAAISAFFAIVLLVTPVACRYKATNTSLENSQSTPVSGHNNAPNHS